MLNDNECLRKFYLETARNVAETHIGGNNMRIYLDNCCYNRPFDDLRQDRIRIEAEKILEEHLVSTGTAMFLQQFSYGAGDYTKEREHLLADQSIEDFERDFSKFNTVKKG